MAPVIALRRLGYRAAYRLLQVWWALTRPSLAGVKCVLSDGGAVLLVRHTYGRRSWDLPGGKVRRGEPPRSAAEREIDEELGLRITAWRALGALEVSDHRRHDTLHCFAAGVTAPPLRLDLGELRCAAWFARDRLPEDRGPFVDDILARAALAHADDDRTRE